jgi:disulfide oxidoreductase YuzD
MEHDKKLAKEAIQNFFASKYSNDNFDIRYEHLTENKKNFINKKYAKLIEDAENDAIDRENLKIDIDNDGFANA